MLLAGRRTDGKSGARSSRFRRRGAKAANFSKAPNRKLGVPVRSQHRPFYSVSPIAYLVISMLVIRRKVAEFLKRERKDFRKWKTLKPDQLKEHANSLPAPLPPLWAKLKDHQKVCFLIGARNRTFAYWCDTGTGKTALSIALSNYFKRAGVSQSNLVLVPRRVNCGEWVREIIKHSPDTPYVVLEEGSQRKWDLLEDNPKAELVITTYAGLARMCCEKVEVRARHGKTKRKLAPQPELVGKLCDRFQGMYLDESTAIGSPRKTLAFRICRKMMATTPIRFCMSGTPFGRDPTTLWGQMFIVDGGDTLGPNLTLFRAVFFKSKRNFWGGMEYKFDRKMEDRLHRVLAHRSIRYEAEAADLPEVIRERKVITLPRDAGAYFDKMRKELKAARGNTVEIRNIFLRMRQLSSGFIGYRDDDSGERAEFEFPYNPKLEMLLHLIESISEDRKIIVYHDFIHSGRVIGRELSALKIPYLHVWGGTKDPSREIATFNTSHKHSVLLLNNSMVMGLNVQVSNYGIFYESPVPAIIRKQAERRIERQHSPHSHVFLYDLIVRGTMDERILSFHKQGKELLKAIIDGDEEV